MRLPVLTLFQRDAVVVEVCATCEGRAEKRGVTPVKAFIKGVLDDAALLRDCRVISAGCLSRCPLDGVTLRIDHDPREWTRGKTMVVDDTARERTQQTSAVVALVSPLVEERRLHRENGSR